MWKRAQPEGWRVIRPLLARRGQAQGFDSPVHIARPAPRTGDGSQRTAHHRVQIHNGEGGKGDSVP